MLKLRVDLPNCILIFTVIIIMVLGGCTPSLENDNVLVTSQPSDIPRNTPMTELSTPSQTPIRTQFSPTSTPSLQITTPTPQSLVTQTATLQSIHNVNLGSVIGFDGTQFLSVDLASGGTSTLFEGDLNGNALSWKALSPNRKWLAYSIRFSEYSALTLVDLTEPHANTTVNIPHLVTEEIHFEWSPDSSYILMSVEESITPSLSSPLPQVTQYLYSIQSGQLQMWQWYCEAIGISPRSNSLAIWCTPIDDNESEYAVIEWGGEIWLSSTQVQPMIPIASRDLFNSSVWLDDGNSIVYRSIDNPNSLLLSTVISGGLETKVVEDSPSFFYDNIAISSDNQYVALYSRSLELNVLGINSSTVTWSSRSLDLDIQGFTSPIWHSDANWLLFSPFVDGEVLLVVIDPVNGAIIKQHEFGPMLIEVVGWLP